MRRPMPQAFRALAHRNYRLWAVLQAAGGLTTGLLGFAVVILPIAAGAVLIGTTMGIRLQLDSAGDMRGRVLSAHGAVSAAAGASAPHSSVSCASGQAPPPW